MLFHSLAFLFSFFCFYLFFFLAKTHRFRLQLLLLFGLFFYSSFGWKPIVLLLVSIFFNYWIGLSIPKRPKPMVIFGILINLSILISFKYLGLFGEIMTDLGLTKNNPFGTILLPVGVSFYTFHNISYLVDIYDKRIRECKDLLVFAIYDMYFPLLLLGPIERAGRLIPQLIRYKKISPIRAISGFFIFCFGVFLKATIADSLSSFLNTSIPNLQDVEPGKLWVMSPILSFQIYADFFGYSLCAIGLSRMCGITLSENFATPFFSSNPREFWNRWHITLSHWFRDYVYIRLGGNRKGSFRWILNLGIVWILTGIWHGSTYGYLFWGIYLAFCLYVYILLSRFHPWLGFLSKPIGCFLTFLSFSLGLLFFRIDSPKDLFAILENLQSWPYFGEIPILVYGLVGFLICMDVWILLANKPRFSFPKPNAIYQKVMFYSFGIFCFIAFCLLSPFGGEGFYYFRF